MHDGYLEIVNNQGGKINTESQYPYTSGGGTSAGQCHAKPANAVPTGITGYANVTHGDEAALKAAALEAAGREHANEIGDLLLAETSLDDSA